MLSEWLAGQERKEFRSGASLLKFAVLDQTAQLRYAKRWAGSRTPPQLKNFPKRES